MPEAANRTTVLLDGFSFSIIPSHLLKRIAVKDCSSVHGLKNRPAPRGVMRNARRPSCGAQLCRNQDARERASWVLVMPRPSFSGRFLVVHLSSDSWKCEGAELFS